MLGAVSLRKNLITVPACEKHNLAKSADDQYLCTVLASHFENNPIAQAHFNKKILRSIIRRPKMLGFFRGLTPAAIEGSQSAAFIVDRPRFDRAIEHIARGVYFHHFANKNTGYAEVMSYSLFDISSDRKEYVNEALKDWRQFSDSYLANQPRYGDNQSVFYYQIVDDVGAQRVVIRLIFYEGFVVDIYFRETRSQE